MITRTRTRTRTRTTRKSIVSCLVALILLLLLLNNVVVGQEPTLSELIGGNDDLSTYLSFFLAFSLSIDTFAGRTIFVPNNQAFIQLEASLTEEGDDTTLLDRLLMPQWAIHTACFVSAHTVFGIYLTSTNLTSGLILASEVQGFDIVVSSQEADTILVNNAVLVETDLVASNGVVQVTSFPFLPSCVGRTIVGLIGDEENRFSTLLELLELADLTTVLRGSNGAPYTLLAPTNDAFDALGNGVLSALRAPENLPFLQQIMRYHVVRQNIIFFLDENLDNRPASYNFRTLQGSSAIARLGQPGQMHYTITDFKTQYNLSETMQQDADLLASNGVVQAIGVVLSPPSVIDVVYGTIGDDYRIMQSLLTSLALRDALSGASGITFFLPPDSAFDTAFSSLRFAVDDTAAYAGHLFHLVLNHLIPSASLRAEDIFAVTQIQVASYVQNITINRINQTIGAFTGASIEERDISVTSGMVQILNRVLVPPSYFFGLAELARSEPNLSVLMELVDLAGFSAFLDTLGPYTLLAPRNSAFDAGLQAFLRAPENMVALQYVLLNHIIPVNIYSLPQDDNGFRLYSLASQTLFFYTEVNHFVNRATLTVSPQTDFLTLAANGVIYQVESVMLPMTLAEIVTNFVNYDLGGSTSIFLAALQQAGLFESLQTMDDFTIFCPIDIAFRATLGQNANKFLGNEWSPHLTLLLNNHLTQGRVNASFVAQQTSVFMFSNYNATVRLNANQDVFLGDALVLFSDVFAGNGYMQVMGGAILPPPLTQTFFSAFVADPNLSELVALIERAGGTTLAMMLMDPFEGPLTMFAPTNAAIVGAKLQGLSEQQVLDIIAYHMVPDSNVFATNFTDGLELTSGFGNDELLTVNVNDGGLITINSIATVDSNVMGHTDRLVANGVFHVISAVLIPPGQPTVAPTPPIPSVTPTFIPPSRAPSLVPSRMPTHIPSLQPSMVPSRRVLPSATPSTRFPSIVPSSLPSITRSDTPTRIPSLLPSAIPSIIPSDIPSDTIPSTLPSLPTQQQGMPQSKSQKTTTTLTLVTTTTLCLLLFVQ